MTAGILICVNRVSLVRSADNEPRGGLGGLCCLAGWVGALVVALLAAGPATASAEPQYDLTDEPLLATTISSADVTLRGRYVRQWTDEQGALVLHFSTDFHAEQGTRWMSADQALVWIGPGRDAETGEKYYQLTIYLSGNAQVREPGGTLTVDSVLLVRGLRTRGRVVKLQDAGVSEDLSEAPLYREALRARMRADGGVAEPEVPATEEPPPGELVPQVSRPSLAPADDRRPRRAIRYRLPTVEPATGPDGVPMFVATGGVYLSQAGSADAAALEIRADSAVVFPAGEGATGLLGGDEATDDEPQADEAETSDERRLFVPPPVEGADDSIEPPAEAGGFGVSGVGDRIRAVYLEGDVVLSLGSRFVRAERLYYDFEQDRALILDAVFRAEIPQRDVPLYIRADEIRQLSAREFAARNAKVTTSEFYTPHYHIGADRVVLRDITVRDTEGRATGPIGANYELTNTTLNVGNVPILWWPYSEGTFETTETLLRRLRTGYSSDRGAELETAWYLFSLLGKRPPPGFDATLNLDFYSDRGPGTGIDVDYEREKFYGLFRGYVLYDDGEDTLGPLRRAEEEPSTHTRGRVLWRHRHYLPRDWEATVELSYVSDPYYLEEWRESEWFEGKEQETLIHLKRARDTEAITFLSNWRLLDFTTQTEHLPELAYRRIGDTFGSPFVFYHESRVGMVRYRPDDRRLWDRRPFSNDGYSDLTFRGDLREEVELPLKLGVGNVVPFATFRGTYWDGQPRDDGGLWRGMGIYGLRAATSLSRVYEEVESGLLDIHRIRHIVRPEFAGWWGHSNTRSEQITPFDYGIETIDAFYGFRAALNQIWQTKRGAEDARRTVDLLTLNLEVGIFGNTDGRGDQSTGYANPFRPENSRTRNYFGGDLAYRLSDTTSLLYDFNIDLNDWSYDRHNLALAIERSPRLAYVFGTRYVGDIDMNLIGGGWNYKLNEKHITSTRAWFDIDGGEVGEVSVAYIRRLPRWYVGLNFEYDNIDDDFTVSVSIWPEGIPEWTLGSRRYTGLARSTGIRP